MSNYENAPQTRLVATHCAVCRRPLCDAKSVELGIGPECRKRHGFNDSAISEEARKAANIIVYQIACDGHENVTMLASRCASLRLLGLHRLASVIEKRVAVVKLEERENGASIEVDAPWSPAFVYEVRSIPGRKWDRIHKVWTVPAIERQRLWNALKRAYPNTFGHGPKGGFVIPANA